MRLPIIGGPLDGKLTIELGESPPPVYFHLTTRPVNDENGYFHHYQVVRHSYWRSHGKYEYQGSEDA